MGAAVLHRKLALMHSLDKEPIHSLTYFPNLLKSASVCKSKITDFIKRAMKDLR